MSLLFGLGHVLNPGATMASILVTMLAGLLLSVAWLRTHGLWLGWGLHFAWNASMGILFGLPVSGINDFASFVQTRAFGRLWLTGGDYGPEGAAFTVIVLLIGIVVLVRVTRDYAWDYTYVPIVAAGYPWKPSPRQPMSRWSNRRRPARRRLAGPDPARDPADPLRQRRAKALTVPLGKSLGTEK